MRVVRGSARVAAHMLGRAARDVVTVIFVVFYVPSYVTGITLRAIVLAATWTAAAIAVGWGDAWPRSKTPDESELVVPQPPLPPVYVNTPQGTLRTR